MLTLLAECDNSIEVLDIQEILECLDLYENILLNESIQGLSDKFKEWLERKQITPEDLGSLIAGVSLLVSSEGRSAITKEDLVNMGLQGDLKRAEKIDNVDLNSMIRKQIIHLGKKRAPRLASMVTEAILNKNYNQIRNFLLKLSVYIDRIKSTEKYVKQDPHVMKTQRRFNPSVQPKTTNS